MSVATRRLESLPATYAAWRTRQSADVNAYPETFTEIVDTVIRFADPPLAGSATDRVWSAANARWE